MTDAPTTEPELPAFTVLEACHIDHEGPWGRVELDLTPGEYTPADANEAAALLDLSARVFHFAVLDERTGEATGTEEKALLEAPEGAAEQVAAAPTPVTSTPDATAQSLASGGQGAPDGPPEGAPPATPDGATTPDGAGETTAGQEASK